jgi:cytidylate kinase
MAVITISRQFGSAGEIIAQMVAQKLNFLLVNKKMISEKLHQYGISEPVFTLFDERKIRFPENENENDEVFETNYLHYLDALHDFFFDLAIRENLVILGRGGQILFKDFPPALHVKIIAPLKNRLQRVQKLYNLDEAAAARLISEQDRDREEYLRHVFGYEWFDLDLYHLVINTGIVGLEEATALIVEASLLQESTDIVSLKDVEEQLLRENIPNKVLDTTGSSPPFAHSSEEEFAKMLDFYQIKWLYEPKTFPLEWDSEGNITEAFSPDFYLPEQDLYVELTTQKQKLVWKKNKKIRRLKELYPDVYIKIIYARDYRGLLLKYGIE